MDDLSTIDALSPKPFLGGYRDTRSGKEFYHAQTQTRDVAKEQRRQRQKERMEGADTSPDVPVQCF